MLFLGATSTVRETEHEKVRLEEMNNGLCEESLFTELYFLHELKNSQDRAFMKKLEDRLLERSVHLPIPFRKPAAAIESALPHSGSGGTLLEFRVNIAYRRNREGSLVTCVYPVHMPTNTSLEPFAVYESFFPLLNLIRGITPVEYLTRKIIWALERRFGLFLNELEQGAEEWDNRAALN